MRHQPPILGISLRRFFFTDPATTEIYTLSLHDALPIGPTSTDATPCSAALRPARRCCLGSSDRKSTRLNSSHVSSSYAVFCLKKKMRGLELLFGYLIALGTGAVVADDLHWADAASLRLLVLLAKRHQDLRLVLLVAMRPRQREPNQALPYTF